MENIYRILENLDIPYQKYEHPAVYTVEEAEKYDHHIDAGKSKNLFLRNRKGNKHYLLVIQSNKRVDLKGLSGLLGESSIGFASAERLNRYLRLTPGAVSPFGLINDVDDQVHVLIDQDLLTYEKLAYHPNINTETLVIRSSDFKKYLDWTENTVSYIEI
jgi:Ala-tRNA(Pro) deacylase